MSESKFEETCKHVNSSSYTEKCDLDESVSATFVKGRTSFNELLCKKIDLGMNMDSKKLFVGGLSWETTESLMKEYFSQFGTVRTCTIKVDKATGHSRGFGFVIFDSESDLDAVLSQPEHWLCNKRIDPKRAKPSQEPARKVFVGGLDPEFSEAGIKDYFRQFGKILAIDLPFDCLRHKRKAFIFVTYATETEARKAAEKEKQLIGESWCDVRIVQRKDTQQQLQQQHSRSRAASWQQQQGSLPQLQPLLEVDLYGYEYWSHHDYSQYDCPQYDLSAAPQQQLLGPKTRQQSLQSWSEEASRVPNNPEADIVLPRPPPPPLPPPPPPPLPLPSLQLTAFLSPPPLSPPPSAPLSNIPSAGRFLGKFPRNQQQHGRQQRPYERAHAS